MRVSPLAARIVIDELELLVMVPPKVEPSFNLTVASWPDPGPQILAQPDIEVATVRRIAMTRTFKTFPLPTLRITPRDARHPCPRRDGRRAGRRAPQQIRLRIADESSSDERLRRRGGIGTRMPDASLVPAAEKIAHTDCRRVPAGRQFLPWTNARKNVISGTVF